MANIMPAAAGSNEGSVAWTQVAGTAATITNSTDHAADGTKSLKVVSTAAGTVNLNAAEITIGAGVTITTSRDVGFASAGGIFTSVYYDFFNGGSYLTTFVLDNNGDAATGSFSTLPDVLVTPGSTTKFVPGIQIDFDSSGQTVYIDKLTIDDGTASATPGINPLLLMGI